MFRFKICFVWYRICPIIVHLALKRCEHTLNSSSATAHQLWITFFYTHCILNNKIKAELGRTLQHERVSQEIKEAFDMV